LCFPPKLTAESRKDGSDRRSYRNSPHDWAFRSKDEQGLKAAYTEVQRHKAGRRARINGTAEVIAGPAAVEFDCDLEALP
jgi:hypothetical protein